jgi:hypothetical protein
VLSLFFLTPAAGHTSPKKPLRFQRVEMDYLETVGEDCSGPGGLSPVRLEQRAAWITDTLK